MAGAAMGVCLQLKGCFKDDGLSHPDLDPVAGGMDFYDNKLLWWTMAEWTISSTWSTLSGLVMVSRVVTYYGVLFASIVQRCWRCQLDFCWQDLWCGGTQLSSMLSHVDMVHECC